LAFGLNLLAANAAFIHSLSSLVLPVFYVAPRRAVPPCYSG
jgi:hypothetical protein